MRNKNSKGYQELPRLATIQEVAVQQLIAKHEAWGISRHHAAEELRMKCRAEGMPEIQLVPGEEDDEVYFCGLMCNIGVWGKPKLLLNPVFIEPSKHVDHWVASVWWNPAIDVQFDC